LDNAFPDISAYLIKRNQLNGFQLFAGKKQPRGVAILSRLSPLKATAMLLFLLPAPPP